MADDRQKLPLIDVASVVVAPVLVMLMVGSLVFFLIEVFQSGKFDGRLDWTFGFFVFGAVLVARIAITQSRGKAVLYGLVLGGACFIACMAFVEYTTPLFKVLGPLLNVGMIALVWWAANKLTWDCTHLDESRKASGRGVLAAAGLDGTKSTTAAEDDEEYDPDRSVQATRKKKKKKEPPPPAVVGWWQRFQKFREWRKKRPHTPGVWVLYFALAAIPLFALGQAVIPADDDKRRASTFWQMAIYVGSALGLLVTTTLMGLKRYLEDRKASIPTALTAAWLGLGLMLIVAFVGVAAVLPRPHSETPLFAVQGGKQDRKASKNAVVKDNSAGKGDGAAGQRKESGDGKGNAKGGKPGGDGKGQAQGQGNNKGGNQSGGNKGDQKGGDKGDGSKGNGEQGNKGDPSKGDDKNGGKGEEGSDGGESDQKSDGEGSDGDGDDAEQGNDPLKQLGQAIEPVGEVIKWIIWVVLALVVLIGGGYFALKYLGNFTGWAKGLLDWFRGLFGKKPKPTAKQVEEEKAEEEELRRPPPFHEFSNPFADGTANWKTARELAEYTFAAFDSWAWDRDLGRQPDETPAEFAARVGEEHPDLEEPGKTLADLYTRAMFSRTDLPADAKPTLAAFWEALDGEPAVR